MSPLSDFGLGKRMRLGLLLPGLALQALFPLERGAHDGVDVIEPRLPLEQLADPSHFATRMAGRRAARLFAYVELEAGDLFDRRSTSRTL